MGALMTSVLQNERDHREFLRTLLDEQRVFFAKEINRMSTRDPRRQSEGVEDMMRNFVTQIENFISKAAQRAPARNDENKPPVSINIDAGAEYSIGDLESREERLAERERALSRREAELENKIARWERQKVKEEAEIARAKLRLSSDRNSLAVSDLETTSADDITRLRDQGRILAAAFISTKFSQGK
jgi:hypothetical protein